MQAAAQPQRAATSGALRTTGTVAQRNWGWKLQYDLDKMVDEMLRALKGQLKG